MTALLMFSVDPRKVAITAIVASNPVGSSVDPRLAVVALAQPDARGAEILNRTGRASQ